MLTPADTNPYFKSSRADIWIIEASELAGFDQFLCELLTPDEMVRYQRFACRQIAATWLAARASLRFLLARYLSLPVKSFAVKTEENGKPYVENRYNLAFNLSHSGNIAVIALADRPVGIDVEQLTRKVDSDAVLQRFFSPLEQSSHAQYSQLDPAHTFFRGWTRKEAVLKATGEGIAGLAHNEISFAPDLPRAMLSYQGSREVAQTWFFHEFSPAAGYICAFACQSPPLQFRKIKLLKQMFVD